MIDVNAEYLVPGFIRSDKNGAALAKGLEAGLQMFAEAVQGGIDNILNPDNMPEWRLDEMAREYNLPYDFTGDIAAKRRIVKARFELAKMAGTPGAIPFFLSLMAPDWTATVTEAAGIHFRYSINIAWTQTDPVPKLDFIEYAVKNYLAPARSTLTGITVTDGDIPPEILPEAGD